MELSPEFIEQHGLSEEQVKAIDTHVESDYIPTLKQEWDQKAGNDADRILDSAATATAKKFGLDNFQRDKGEKYDAFVERLAGKAVETKQVELENKSKEYEEKLKNFKGSEELKSQLEAEKAKIDEYQRQIAELEPLKGYDEKYSTLESKYSSLKKQTAFNGIKPTFPQEANQYEVKAKWDAFVQGVEEKYNVEIVDGEAIAVDKENPHKTVKLADMVDQDEDIKALLVGRQQKGTGKQKQVQPEGLPFSIPEGANGKQKTEAVRGYLASKGITPDKDSYAKEFKDLYSKIPA